MKTKMIVLVTVGVLLVVGGMVYANEGRGTQVNKEDRQPMIVSAVSAGTASSFAIKPDGSLWACVQFI